MLGQAVHQAHRRLFRRIRLESTPSRKGRYSRFYVVPALRRANHISFDFVAFGLDLDLLDELFEDPLKVYYSAGDIIRWSNVCTFALGIGSVGIDQHGAQDVQDGTQ